MQQSGFVCSKIALLRIKLILLRSKLILLYIKIVTVSILLILSTIDYVSAVQQNEFVAQQNDFVAHLTKISCTDDRKLCAFVANQHVFETNLRVLLNLCVLIWAYYAGTSFQELKDEKAA